MKILLFLISLIKTIIAIVFINFILPIFSGGEINIGLTLFLCDWIFNDFGISLPRYNIVIGIFVIMFFAGALCVIRNQPAKIPHYNPN